MTPPVNRKIVLVLANDLSAPIAANTSALLALSIGALQPDIIGPDIPDADRTIHAGISGTPVPVLSAARTELPRLAADARAQDLEVIDFTTTAARARTYDAYTTNMAATPTTDLDYLGIAITGPAKAVTSLTGALPLMR